MFSICVYNACTGCSVCADLCPNSCIYMAEDDLGEIHPNIDTVKCIDCGLCVKVCPNNHDNDLNQPYICYAAWSSDLQTRLTSASGGIAAEFYSHILDKGGKSVGVTIDSVEGCHYIPIETRSDISKVKNSKYVQACTIGIYKYAKSQIVSGIPFMFVGLPCHVAAFKSYLGKEYDNLLTVDLICHGQAPYAYFRQHLNRLKANTHCDDLKYITFRDPKKGTRNHRFSIYSTDESRPVYSKRHLEDLYQHGYHRFLTYRHSCYECQYAQNKRIGDITIGDFTGLGAKAPYSGEQVNVSCVLINTHKGELFFNEINGITKDERPLAEAFDYERQLNSPSTSHPKREVFIECYRRTGDFEYSAHKVLKYDLQLHTLKSFISSLVKFTKRLIPLKLKTIIYNLKNNLLAK